MNLGRLLLMTPAFIRAMMESDMTSVWQPRSFLEVRLYPTALDTPPMPSWMQAPSGIWSKRNLAMASVSRSASMGPPGTVSFSSSAHTTCLAWEMWILVRSPVT